jgi:hypothetical protein
VSHEALQQGLSLNDIYRTIHKILKRRFPETHHAIGPKRTKNVETEKKLLGPKFYRKQIS